MSKTKLKNFFELKNFPFIVNISNEMILDYAHCIYGVYDRTFAYTAVILQHSGLTVFTWRVTFFPKTIVSSVLHVMVLFYKVIINQSYFYIECSNT